MCDLQLHIEKLFRTTEELENEEIAHINGKIPPWVKGLFIRNGPAQFDFNLNSSNSKFTVNHFLDGMAMLSSFKIEGDIVKFNKKFIQSEAYKKANLTGKNVFTEFGTKAHADKNKSFFSRLITAVLPLELTDNSHINIYKLGGENGDLFASSETNYFRRINSQLESGERLDTNKVFGVNICSAHPCEDNGTLYNIGCSVITGLKYQILSIPPQNKGQNCKDVFKNSKIIATINSGFPTGLMSYNHSFGITQNYIVFIEQPFVMNIAKAALSYLKAPAFNDWLSFRSDLKNRFYLIEKSSGKVVKTETYSSNPFAFLHVINSYEENEQVVIDLLTYSNGEMLEGFYLKNLRNGILDQNSLATPQRFVIPILEDLKDVPEGLELVDVKSEASAVRVENSIILKPENLSKSGQEMCCINKSFQSSKYSYFYSSGIHAPNSDFAHCICKVDLKTKKTLVWKDKDSDYTFPGEPQFISNKKYPKPEEEDDGILLTAVTNTRKNTNDFLLFLDAKTLLELGRAQFKSHIPQSIHGMFLPDY